MTANEGSPDYIPPPPLLTAAELEELENHMRELIVGVRQFFSRYRGGPVAESDFSLCFELFKTVLVLHTDSAQRYNSVAQLLEKLDITPFATGSEPSHWKN